MILSRLKNAINNNNGMALIVALCVATFIMALSLALIFSTAQISSNINNKLLREQAQQQASSFADIIGQELQDDTSTLYSDFCKLCDNADTLEKDCDLSLVVPDGAKLKKYGSLTVTLCKVISSDATSDDNSDWQDFSGEGPSYCENPVDFDVNVTVVVTMEKGIYATVTDTYTRSKKYEYEYVLQPDGTEYKPYTENDKIYFRRENVADSLLFNGTPLTMEMLMENKSGERDDLGSGKKLTRKRKGDGVSVFTFKGRE